MFLEIDVCNGIVNNRLRITDLEGHCGMGWGNRTRQSIAHGVANVSSVLLYVYENATKNTIILYDN